MLQMSRVTTYLLGGQRGPVGSEPYWQRRQCHMLFSGHSAAGMGNRLTSQSGTERGSLQVPGAIPVPVVDPLVAVGPLPEEQGRSAQSRR